MPAEIGLAEDLEHLKGGIGLDPGHVHKVLRMPRANEGLPAERVAAFPGEGMPIGHGKAQVVFHAFAHHDLISVVMSEGERVGAVFTFEFDRGDIAKETGHQSIAFRFG